jgi:hypothetical protein
MEKSDLCPRVPARLVGEGEEKGWSGGTRVAGSRSEAKAMVERWS